MNKYSAILFSIGTVVLCVLGSFPLTTGFYVGNQKPFSKHIITVDDEPGVADYTSIKDALNHSSPGDTIEVFSGTYNEHGISITEEGISLIGMPYDLGNGSDTGKPFINGQGLENVVDVRAQNVSIIGFQMENKGGGNYDWVIIHIKIGADNCTVSNNTLCYSSNTILYCGSNYSSITNNTIRYPGLYYGICLGSPGHHNLISGNVIDQCPIGICFWGSEHNTISGNLISNCSEIGVSVDGSMNFFQYNTFENNSVGLNIYQSEFNIVKENNFIHNTYQASFGEAFGVYTNHWIHNYWGRPRLLPYPIQGSNFVFQWVQFDWRPALLPNKVPNEVIQ